MEKIEKLVSPEYQAQLARLAGHLVTEERFGKPQFELRDPVELGWQEVEE